MAGVTIDFNANLARLEDGINRANQQLSGFRERAASLASGLTSAFAALGAGLSAAGIVSFGKSVIDAADDLNDLSIKTGIAVEKLSGLNLAADQSGTDLNGTAAAINKLSKNIGANAEEFAKLGITAKEPLVAFEQLADVFNSIEDPQQRAAFAAKALGKSWEEVAPLLALGGQGIAEIADKAGAASGITKELAEASDQFNDTLAELSANARGAAVQGFAPLVPILNELVVYFRSSDKEAEKNSTSINALKETYKGLAEGLAVVNFGFQVAGKEIAAFAAQTVALAHLDLKGFNAIDKALEDDLANANQRLLDFFAKIEGYKPEVNVDLKTNVNNPESVNQSAAPATPGSIDLTGGNANIQSFIKTTADGQKILSEALKKMQADLKSYLNTLGGQLDEETSLFDFRNKKLEASLDLGLVDQADYFQQKEKLQKDQLAETKTLLDQEINALRQFQSQATEEAAKSDAQEKINALIQKKTDLERDSQIQTLQNAAAARQALGDQAEGLININGLLEQQIGNIIGLSKAQAELNLQIGGTASAEDVVNKKKIFVSEDGKSFSDRPTEVGVQLNLDEANAERVQQQLINFRDKAIADSAILLGVDIDQAKAITKINEASSSINQKLTEIKPVTLGMDVDQALVVSAAQKAREAAQAAVQPVIIPVVYQAQNTPATAAAGVVDLTQAALASGGR